MKPKYQDLAERHDNMEYDTNAQFSLADEMLDEIRLLLAVIDAAKEMGGQSLATGIDFGPLFKAVRACDKAQEKK